MLEIDRNLKKITIDTLKWGEESLFLVKIPDEKRKYFKKASKLLKNKRVVVWENCDERSLKSFGIQPVSPKKLYRYITDKIFIASIERLDFLKDAKVVIYAGRISENEKGMLCRIIENSRQISIYAGNGDDISHWLMENYGISATKAIKNADIIIRMYDSNFSLWYIDNKRKYILDKLEISLEFENIFPETHLKSACLAGINLGVMDERAIVIKNLSFKCEN